MLLWLLCRPAAVAPIQLLAWELPNAAGAALKRQKTKEGERENVKMSPTTESSGSSELVLDK